MATGRHAVIEPQERVIQAVIRVLSAERSDEHAYADAEEQYAEEQLALCARDLFNAIDALPPEERPIGW